MKIYSCIIFLVCLLLLSGCSANYYERSADKEAGKILNDKSAGIKNSKIPPQYLSGENTNPETVVLDLRKCLVLAAGHNADYQTQKENVYLSALDLTYQRYLFKNRYNVTGNVAWENNAPWDGVSENIGGTTNFSLIRWLASGAQVAFNLSANFLQYLSGNRQKDYQTFASLNILQPLFRGAGREIAEANLVQAERNVVYSIRTFIRYQETFSVTVSSQFFNVLLLKNNLNNYWNSYTDLKTIRERLEILSQAGRIPQFQVDQARQDEYSSYQNWITALNSYQSALDSFRILLGFTADTKIVLEEKQLENLLKQGVPELKGDLKSSLERAEEKRLDLINAYDSVYDAKRSVHVAADSLRTELDANLTVSSQTEQKSSITTVLQRPLYNFGFTFDLPLDRLQQRNNYKSALIQLDRATRNFNLTKDNVALDVNNSYRNLYAAYQSYLIQKSSMQLAGERVESTDMLLQAGRATTRDLLDAQDSYLTAINSLSSAVVTYLVSYLQFLESGEQLELDDNGVWKGDLYEKLFNQTGKS